MIDKALKEAIQSYSEQMTQTTIIALNMGIHKKRTELQQMLQDIASATDKIQFREENLSDLRSPLSFKLLAKGKSEEKDTGIVFSGIPGGHEFNSLILAILQAGGVPLKLDPSIQSLVQSIKTPLNFETAVSLSCHNCPDVVQALNQFALLNNNIRSEMVEGGAFQEWVDEKNIQGVPAVLLNGENFANGKIEVGVLIEKLSSYFDKESSSSSQPSEAQDVLVIGGGPAGVSSAIYAARKGLKVTMVAERFGGQVKDTMGIENLISVPSTTGPELTNDLRAHLEGYNIALKEHIQVSEIQPGKPHQVQLSTGEIYETKTIIISTGAKWRELGVPGEKENVGQGVAYCPHCDGPFFKDKDVAVIGGGNSGVEAALDLAGIVKSVTLVEFLPELKADQILIDQAVKRDNIRIIKNTATQEIQAENEKVTALVVQDRSNERSETIPLAGVFVQIGLIPNSGFLGDLVEKNRYGEIEINDRCETSVPGIYACGDVTTVPYKQIVISMGEGAKAAISASDYLMKW